MNIGQKCLILFFFTTTYLRADSSGYLNLRARVNPSIIINFKSYKSIKNNSTFLSMKTESNAVSFETAHKIEIEDNIGLDIELEEENILGKNSKEQRYKITPKKDQSTNASVVFKISAN